MSDERSGGGLSQSLLLEVISHVREELTALSHLHHQAVEVAGLHGLVEADDVGVAKASHQLSFSQQVLTDIFLSDFVCFNDLDGHLPEREREREEKEKKKRERVATLHTANQNDIAD